MRENHYTFPPTHKIWVLSNPRPRADSADAALWERLKLIPFEIVFRDKNDADPAHEEYRVQDKKLPERLKGEYQGILTWAVRGCLAWQGARGLNEPRRVDEVTREYRDEQRELNPVSAFLASSEGELPTRGITLAEYTAKYNASRRHGPPLSSRDMAEVLRGMGCKVDRGGKGKLMVRPLTAAKPAARRGKVVKLLPTSGTGSRF
jgi:phage/plasmid-associated DNA primase